MVAHQSYLSIIKHFPNQATDDQTSPHSPRHFQHHPEAQADAKHPRADKIYVQSATDARELSLLEPTD